MTLYHITLAALAFAIFVNFIAAIRMLPPKRKVSK